MNPLHYEISNAIEDPTKLPRMIREFELVSGLAVRMVEGCRAWVSPKGAWWWCLNEWHPVNWDAWENAGRLYEALFDLVDTPDLIEICNEDVWIGKMRCIYLRVRRRLDCDIALRQLIAEEIQEQFLRQARRKRIEKHQGGRS